MTEEALIDQEEFFTCPDCGHTVEYFTDCYCTILADLLEDMRDEAPD
jgi:hypothetical protein